MSKKTLIVISLIFVALVALPLSIFLFPWAQSLTAIEFPDGTKGITTIDAGTWITKLGMLISSVSLVLAILIGIFYNQKNK